MTGGVKLTAAVVSVAVVLAGCGSSGTHAGFDPSATTNDSHTYFLTSPMLGGFSVTVVSSVAIPAKFFTGLTAVRHAWGKPRCWMVRTVHGLQGRSAFMNGQLVTLKLNGTSPRVAALCAHLKKVPFNPSTIAPG